MVQLIYKPDKENQPEKIKKRKPNPKENVKMSAEERKKVIKVSPKYDRSIV